MRTITPTEWLLVIGATARLSWLVINDRITEAPRNWITHRAGRRQDRGLAFLITCPWCVSVWIALPVIGWAWAFSGALSYVPLGIAAVSMAAALLFGWAES